MQAISIVKDRANANIGKMNKIDENCFICKIFEYKTIGHLNKIDEMVLYL